MNQNERAAKIRRLLRTQAPTLRVTRDTGTASLWVTIHGSADRFGKATSHEAKAMSMMGIGTERGAQMSSPAGSLSYEEQDKFLEKFGKWDKKRR